MNKAVAVLFAVLLIGGLFMIVYGTHEASSLTKGSEYFHYNGNGEYVSSPLQMNTTYVLSVLGAGAYLVSASNLGSVNASNAYGMSLLPSTTLNLTNNTESIYRDVPSGSYYLVYFGNSQPYILYSIQTAPGLANVLSTLIVVGIAIVVGDLIFLALSFMIGKKG